MIETKTTLPIGRMLKKTLVLACWLALPGMSAFAQKTSTTPPPKKPAATQPAKPQTATAKPAAPPPGKPLPANVSDTAVARLFEKPADIRWVRYFSGRLDDASNVNLSLGSDGRSCRGYLSYPQTRLRFRLDGTLDTAGRLVLRESDARNQHTGALVGRVSGRQLEADWLNRDSSLGLRLEAREANVGQVLPAGPCGENKWVNRYISRWNNARADLVLSRLNNGLLYGYLWIESDNKTYPLRGSIDPDGVYEMEAVQPGGEVPAAILRGSFKLPQNTDLQWVGSGEKRTIKFTLRDNLLVGCYESADYVTSYDALYPRTRCDGCNAALDRKVQDWVTRCKAAFAAQKRDATPANRNSLRASAWSEIVFWTDDLFCGYLTFANSWDERTEGLAFNFNLKTGREILLEDLFVKSFNFKKWLDEYARKESPKMAKFAADPKFREWLSKEGFPLFAVRREGLEMSTLFHPVFGQQRLLVPYGALKPYMRKDNPVAEFVR